MIEPARPANAGPQYPPIIPRSGLRLAWQEARTHDTETDHLKAD